MDLFRDRASWIARDGCLGLRDELAVLHVRFVCLSWRNDRDLAYFHARAFHGHADANGASELRLPALHDLESVKIGRKAAVLPRQYGGVPRRVVHAGAFTARVALATGQIPRPAREDRFDRGPSFR